MTQIEQLVLAAALPLGLIIGVIDARSEEVQGPVLLLVIAGALLAALAPRRALAIGVLVGLGVPLAHAYVRLAHVALPYPMNGYWGSFLALIPAMLAAMAASWIRIAAARAA